jgi:HEAT repeat protein
MPRTKSTLATRLLATLIPFALAASVGAQGTDDGLDLVGRGPTPLWWDRGWAVFVPLPLGAEEPDSEAPVTTIMADDQSSWEQLWGEIGSRVPEPLPEGMVAIGVRHGPRKRPHLDILDVEETDDAWLLHYDDRSADGRIPIGAQPRSALLVVLRPAGKGMKPGVHARGAWLADSLEREGADQDLMAPLTGPAEREAVVRTWARLLESPRVAAVRAALRWEGSREAVRDAAGLAAAARLSRHQDEVVRWRLVDLLLLRAGGHGVAATALSTLLGDSSPRVRERALEKTRAAGLTHLVAPALARGLVAGTPIGGDAERALRDAGASAVPSLIAALKNVRPAERVRAAQMLGAIGPRATPAVDTLLRLARTDVTPVRIAALRALGAIGQQPAEVGRTLDVYLSGRDRDLAATAKDVALEWIRDPDPALRLAAFEVLAPRIPDDPPSYRILEPLRRDKDPRIRARAAQFFRAY